MDAVTEKVRFKPRTLARNEASTVRAVHEFVEIVPKTDLLAKNTQSPHYCTLHTDHNLPVSAERVQLILRTPHRHCSQQLSILRLSMMSILHKGPINSAVEGKRPLRYGFSVCALQMIQSGNEFDQRVIYCNAGHFHLGGYYSKQTCRI